MFFLGLPASLEQSSRAFGVTMTAFLVALLWYLKGSWKKHRLLDEADTREELEVQEESLVDFGVQ